MNIANNTSEIFFPLGKLIVQFVSCYLFLLIVGMLSFIASRDVHTVLTR